MYYNYEKRFYYHEACTYLVLLHICYMQDTKSGLYKGRLQLKNIPYDEMPGGRRPDGIQRPTYFIRATNGHTFPGILCPESLFEEVVSYGKPGDPEWFVHGTTWGCVNSILQKRAFVSWRGPPRGQARTTIDPWMSMSTWG